jgi:hypothetical protein
MTDGVKGGRGRTDDKIKKLNNDLIAAMQSLENAKKDVEERILSQYRQLIEIIDDEDNLKILKLSESHLLSAGYKIDKQVLMLFRICLRLLENLAEEGKKQSP